MAERRDDDDDSEVGYRKPPRHSQFKAGVSGNPRGRPRRAPKASGSTDIERLFDDVCGTVEIQGKTREITGTEAIYRSRIKAAMSSTKAKAALFKRYRELMAIVLAARSDERHDGIIRFIFPDYMPMDDWEAIAVPSQRKLMEDVRK